MAKLIGNAPNQVPTNADLGSMAFEDRTNYITKNNPVHQPFRNLIINGDMSINQRNATINNGTNTNTYAVDRFHMFGAVANKMSGQQSTTAPTYFKNSFLTTSLASTTTSAGDAYGVRHIIEGSNIVNLSWGSASAKTVTLSFWVRSSITGTYALALFNKDAPNRSYVETYTINSADTFEYKTITIEGDTAGTWLTTNGQGIQVWWDLGSGSNFNTTAGSWGGGLDVRTSGSSNWIGTSGATFYITGVQLEAGTSASDFEFLPRDVNLNRCHRYCYVPSNEGTSGDGYVFAWGYANTSSQGVYFMPLPTLMRSQPTLVLKNTSNALEQGYHNATVTQHNTNVVTRSGTVSSDKNLVLLVGGASFSGGQGVHLRFKSQSTDETSFVVDAEL